MTKGELKNIILRIRALTGLPEQTRVTYYRNEENNLFYFKLWFDPLKIPKGLLNPTKVEDDDETPTIWKADDKAPNAQKGFPYLDYKDEYDDDFVITEINTDEGYFTILPDDQNYKIIGNYKEAKDSVDEAVNLASKKASKRLVETYQLVEEEKPSNSDVQDELDSQNPNEKAEKESKKDEPEAEGRLLVIPVAILANLKKGEASDLIKTILEQAPKITYKDDDGKTQPYTVCATTVTTTGISFMRNYQILQGELAALQPNAPGAIFFPEDAVGMHAKIEAFKDKGAYRSKVSSKFKKSESAPGEVLNLKELIDVDPEGKAALDIIVGKLDSLYVTTEARFKQTAAKFKETVLKDFGEFAQGYINLYRADADKAKEEIKDENEKAEEEESESTESSSGATEKTESVMRRLFNYIREAEEESSEEDKEKEKAEADKAKEDEDKENDGRRKAWKKAEGEVEGEKGAPNTLAFVITEILASLDVLTDVKTELDKIDKEGKIYEFGKDLQRQQRTKAKSYAAKERSTAQYECNGAADAANFAIDVLFNTQETGTEMGSGNKSATALFTKMDTQKHEIGLGKDNGSGTTENEKLPVSGYDFVNYCYLTGDEIKQDMKDSSLKGAEPKPTYTASLKIAEGQ